MCGFYGIFSPNSDLARERVHLSSMGDLLGHRGPDHRAEHFFRGDWGTMGLGFTRLAILDLKTGDAPIISPSDGVTIAANGQIYNYIELKEELRGERFQTTGDIEVALHLYRRLGLDFVKQLNGMFAGVIFDPIKSSLLLFRDRFGIKPLYYTFEEDRFIFSSEIKALSAAMNGRLELNEKLLPVFFSYRHVPGEETLFKNIYRLPPSTIMELNLNSQDSKKLRYWDYLDYADKNQKMDEQAAEAEFLRVFQDAVEIRLRSDVEVGCLLSGGMDSSAVASLTAKKIPTVKLFTMGFGPKEYDETDDTVHFLSSHPKVFGSARQIRGHCPENSLASLPRIIKSVEEPLGLAAMIPTNDLCRMTADHVKVVLTGEGADELFCGYRKFLVQAAAMKYTSAPADEKKRLENQYPELMADIPVPRAPHEKRHNHAETLFGPDGLERLLGRSLYVGGGATLPTSATPLRIGENFEELDKSVAMELQSRLPDYVALRLDKISMRHSLETRTPFLDFRLAELAARIPSQYKLDVKEGHGKNLCRKALFKAGILDRETAFRTKKPFTMPIAEALAGDKNELPTTQSKEIDVRDKELLDSVFENGGMIQSQGLLNHDFVEEIRSRVSAEGITPETLVSHADRLFAVLVFTLWYEEFL